MEDIESILFTLINKSISLEICDKEFKSGILRSSKILPFFIELFIERTPEKIDKLKIPFPFGYEFYEAEGLVYFDYRIDTFNKESKSEFNVEDVSSYIQHKFFDKILTVTSKTNE